MGCAIVRSWRKGPVAVLGDACACLTCSLSQDCIALCHGRGLRHCGRTRPVPLRLPCCLGSVRKQAQACDPHLMAACVSAFRRFGVSAASLTLTATIYNAVVDLTDHEHGAAVIDAALGYPSCRSRSPRVSPRRPRRYQMRIRLV